MVQDTSFFLADILRLIALLATITGLVLIWRKGPRWARILIGIAAVLAVIAAVLLWLYILALGSADWSL